MRRTGFAWVTWLASAAAFVGCSGSDPGIGDTGVENAGVEDSAIVDGGPPDAFVPDPYPADCENVNALECLAPWPSSRFLVDDATTRTGRRLALPPGAMPRNARGVGVLPDPWNQRDGFSPATSMMTVFDVPLDTSILADEVHIDDSLDSDSPTVILEVSEDGTEVTRVAHFAEIDTWEDVSADRVPFYIRPAARLRERTRYVVAIRNLVTTDGAPVEPSDYFRALRDDTALPDAEDLESRRAHFEEIFGLLAQAGVERSGLIEAWDFETASDESLYDDAVRVRDEGLRQNDASCRITVGEVVENPDDNIYRRIEGTIRVPLFINSTDPGGSTDASIDFARLRRDADGHPIQNAETPFAEVPFTASIPMSVYERIRDGGDPARLLTYGHGLLGSRDETTAGWFRDTIQELEMVSIAVDWWGMSFEDVPRVLKSLGKFDALQATGERLDQGLLNFLVLTHSFIRLGHEECELVTDGDDPFLITPTEGAPRPVFDPDERYYYGNSQGGIMGLALAGLSTDIRFFVSGVTGMSYSVMIPRSVDWVRFATIMSSSYRRQVDRSMLMTMSQSLWDNGEPATFAPFIHETLPCTLGETQCPGGFTPTHHVLMMIGQDDAQVPNISADIAARSIREVPVLLPSPYTPWDVEQTTGSDESSDVLDALAIFAIPGTRALPLGTRNPGEDTPAHEGVRRSAAGHRMMDRYFRRDGLVTQTCDGVCDPD